MDESMVLCVDFGHSTCRLGYCGDDTPLGEVATYAKYDGDDYSFIPMKNGIHGNLDPFFDNVRFCFSGFEIQDYDLFRRVLQHGMDKLFKEKMDTSQTKILFTNFPPRHPVKMKKKLTEICMEYFGFQGILFSDQNTCSTYSSGRTTAFSLCMGGGQTSLFFLYEGYAIDKFTFQAPFGGNDIALALWDILRQKPEISKSPSFGTNFVNLSHLLTELHLPIIPRESKARNVSFSSPPEREDMMGASKEFVLPDNTKIEFSTEEIEKATSIIFKGCPDLNIPSLESAIFEKLDNVKEFVATDMIHSGGVTFMKGFKSNVQNIIDNYVFKNLPREKQRISGTQVGRVGTNNQARSWRMVCPPERLDSAWIGGSILGSLSTAQKMFLDSEQLMEESEFIKSRFGL